MSFWNCFLFSSILSLSSKQCGGGEQITNVNVTKNTHFISNEATGASSQCYGGAIRSEGNVEVYDSTFRENNAYDEEHGRRASKLIDTIRHTELKELNDEQIAKLKRACKLHTIQHRTGDMTIDICFDSDRLDLYRVGILPIPERMATKQGADFVTDPHKYLEFYKEYEEGHFDNSFVGSGI